MLSVSVASSGELFRVATILALSCFVGTLVLFVYRNTLRRAYPSQPKIHIKSVGIYCLCLAVYCSCEPIIFDVLANMVHFTTANLASLMSYYDT